MASLLLIGDSLPRHLEITRRHLRKCSKTPGAASFAERIKPIYDNLKSIQSKLTLGQEEIQDGYDDIDLADTLLDDTVRDLFDLVTISDRRASGLPLLPQVFPAGKFGYIVDSPLASEIDEVKKTIDRLTEADTEGKFAEYVEKLTAGINAVEESIDALKAKIESQKSLKSEAEVIKSNLRWQYELNYLDARKQMGRKRAELLFPKKSNGQKNEEEISTEE